MWTAEKPNVSSPVGMHYPVDEKTWRYQNPSACLSVVEINGLEADKVSDPSCGLAKVPPGQGLKRRVGGG